VVDPCVPSTAENPFPGGVTSEGCPAIRLG
jgi:hypothetical protein